MKFLENMKKLTGKSNDEPKFIDAEMETQRKRLRMSRRNVARVGIDMTRNRNELQEKERQLMAQVRKCVERGDTTTARLLATQVLHFRSLAAENLVASTKLMGRAAVMESRSRLTSDSLQAMRGIVWAESGPRKAKEAMELSLLADQCDAVEDLAAEAFEDIYEPPTPESATSPGRLLVDEVIQQATANMTFAAPSSPTRPKENDNVAVVFRVYNTPKSTLPSPMTAEAADDGLLAFPKVPSSEPANAATVLRIPRHVNGADLKT
jgi:hypothetical protein